MGGPSGAGISGSGASNNENYQNNIGRIYSQNPYFQKGYGYLGGQRRKTGAGLGSALSSVWRFAYPFIKKGAQALGVAAADVASNVASDVIQGKNVKDSVLEHAKTKGLELLKDAPTALKEAVNKNITAPPSEISFTPSADLVGPTPVQFRRIARKRKSGPIQKRYSQPAKRKKYPALKHFQ